MQSITKLDMHHDDLHAYLDDALNSNRREKVAEAVATSPELSSALNSFRRQAAGLHQLYDHILKEPIPEKILECLYGGDR